MARRISTPDESTTEEDKTVVPAQNVSASTEPKNASAEPNTPKPALSDLVQNAPTPTSRRKAMPQMPSVPNGYFWRVKTTENQYFGTMFEVTLRQRLKFGFSKKIGTIACAANEYAENYQGSNLNDTATLSALANALWKAGEDRSATITRQANYQTRAADMKRYARDYDAQHRLDEVIA